MVVADVPLVAAVTRSHPLAGRTGVALDALASLPLITLTRGTGTRSVLDEALTHRRLQPRIAFEASDPHLLAQLATHGLGVAVVPAPAVKAYQDELHQLTITQPRMRARLALSWQAEAPISPATQAFIGHVRDAIGGARPA